MSPTRRIGLLGGVGALAALAGLGGALWRQPAPGAVADPALWARRFPRPDGGELALADFLGRPLLLNFWATWCPPCVRELPMLERFHQAQAADGWQVLGLALDGASPVREFLRRMPLRFPLALGGLDGMQVSRQLGNTNGALPFSVAFTRLGHLHARQLGELDETRLKRWQSEV